MMIFEKIIPYYLNLNLHSLSLHSMCTSLLAILSCRCGLFRSSKDVCAWAEFVFRLYRDALCAAADLPLLSVKLFNCWLSCV